MAFRQVRRSFAIGIVATMIFALPASGHILEPWSTDEGIGIFVGYTWHRSGDTIEAWSSATWNSTRASNLHHDAGESGYRFTMNAEDISNNLNATGQSSTTYWDPYYDKDDDNADLKYEEAEITAQHVNFPSANVWYQANMRFSHSYFASGEWRYDSGGGTIQFDESLSQQLWWTGDLWDTTYCCASWANQVTYPSKSASIASAASMANPAAVEPTGKAASPATAAPSAFTATRTADPGEVLLLPDLSVGLDAYRDNAVELGTELVRSGAARGIVTFDKPATPADLRRLASIGVVVNAVEAVSSAGEDRNRWTFFSDYGPNFWNEMRTEAAHQNVRLLGVTSAEVVVPDSASFDAAMKDSATYLIDLSLAQYDRLHPAAKDVVMNDLYWVHAGWSDPHIP